MCKGITNGKLSKQIIITKSSTETELVDASDYIPWTVRKKGFGWSRVITSQGKYFIKVMKAL